MTDADGADWPPIKPLPGSPEHTHPQVYVRGFEPQPLDPALKHSPEAIVDEVVRRMRVRAEQIMGGRPEDFELIDEFEQAIRQLVDEKQDFVDDRGMIEVWAAIMGLEVHAPER